MATFAIEPVTPAEVGPDQKAMGYTLKLASGATFKAYDIVEIDVSANPDEAANAENSDSAYLALATENAADAAYLAAGPGFSSTKTHVSVWSLKGRRFVMSTSGDALAAADIGATFDLGIDANGRPFVDLAATTDNIIKIIAAVDDYARDTSGVWKKRGIGDTGARAIVEFVDSACYL